MGYTKNLFSSPYGSTQAWGNDPAQWLESDNRTPLDVYQGAPVSSVFQPHVAAGNPLSVSSSNNFPWRKCVGGPKEGADCDSSADCYNANADPPSGGVCMGIGRYCYSNDTQMTNGQACGINNCPDGYICKAPTAPSDNRNNTTGFAATVKAAFGRLQSLFAQIFGVWKWTGTQYTSCHIPGGSEGGIDCGLDNTDPMPRLTQMWKRNGQVAGGLHPIIGNAKLNGKIGAIVLQAPGGMIDLSFTSDLDDEHQPLDFIGVNWLDGSANNLFNLSVNEQPSPANPHHIWHYYGCSTTSDGERCASCWNAGSNSWVDSADGSCVYSAPYITIADHWGWCATPTNERCQRLTDSCTGIKELPSQCDPVANGVQPSGLSIEIRPRGY
jgi:hypothetical protein